MTGELSSQIVFMFLTILVLAFAVSFVSLWYRQSMRSERIQRQLLEMALHSRFSTRRADLEESLINLGMGFQKDAGDFAEVNHLALSGQKINENKENKFLSSLGLDGGVRPKSNQIFVLTPFSDAEKETFAVMRSTLIESGFQVFRGDETKRSDILQHVVKSMIESQIIIANLNGRNPNVMYELGIAHMLDKPVILTAKVPASIEEIPFDLRAKNIILYEDYEALTRSLAKAVLQTLTHASREQRD